MKLLQEFKEFAVKGNMMDMAIGIIIGASFNQVIDVLVKQILLPPLSLLSDGINLDNKKLILRESQTNAFGDISVQEVAISYGQFIETFLDFLIVGFTIFMVVKFINRLNKKAEDPSDKTVSTPKNIQLLMDMNSLLEEQNRILEIKVAERTAELQERNSEVQSMLSNMSQGLLTILPNGSVHSEFSSHLETLFKTSTIAGENAFNFLFSAVSFLTCFFNLSTSSYNSSNSSL